MKIIKLLVMVLLFLPLTSQGQDKSTPVLSSEQFNKLEWRNIGPFRGGRSVASAGVVGQPLTYYMGTTGGGVWKTVNAGNSWENISDGFFKTGSVGAIAVSESNPNIVVVGMGEHPARGVMTSMGDGVYKSTDAGKTWKHIGLDNTRHISDVIIHPTNPDIIFISGQGAQYGSNEERGIFRSNDGGKTWEKVFYVDENTGASGLTMDFTNPTILYAAMWEHRRHPWTMISGGEKSGLYKSTDGGDTWTQMKKGLPKMMGKSGISVSRANPERVYAVIEADPSEAGVYRSDNAGETWKRVNADRNNVTRSWYYMEIFADPQDENIVYVLNAPTTKSIDGGVTFTNVPVPHGDTHDMWINPNDNQKIVHSNDGGANVSLDGAKSWSTQQNQATAQFYRVNADNLVPYNVYGGQQDNSAIRIASRTTGGGIDWKNWESVAGCESAYAAFDPDNPDVVFGGCYQGIIGKWMADSKESKPIKEYAELGLGILPKDFKYRYNWNAPIISSPHDRNTIYHAGNVVFKTTNEGDSWEVISPDLTRNDKSKQGPGGQPFTNEGAGGENYNTIMYIVESPHEEGVIYAGSDDGLVHITRNGGTDWENITPKGLPEGIINSIEVSPHDPATAYMVMMNYKAMDLDNYIYKTSNYGKSWTKIVNGIDGEHNFTRVVREDPKRKGLLYAGTETGLFVSLNDGKKWERLQLNLPIVPLNDIMIHQNDLIAATAGRSFWILDDIAAIQNFDANKKNLEVFKPKETYLFFGGSSRNPQIGHNPRQGVTFDYFVPEKADSIELKVDILQGNNVIRSYSSKADKNAKSWTGAPPKDPLLPAKEGYNRFTWDFKREALPGIEGVFVLGDQGGSRVAPGTYTIKLTLEGESSSTTVKVLPNPNIDTTPADYNDQQRMLTQIEAAVTDIHESVISMRSAKSQLQTYINLLEGNDDASELTEKAESLIKRITVWEENLIQPKQKTFQDVINFHNQLNAHFIHLKGYVDAADPTVTKGAKERYRDLVADWKVYEKERDAIINTEMSEFNSMYKQLNLPAIIMDK
ncbi:MAG: glycosyl hydrolase [Balneola sp.]